MLIAKEEDAEVRKTGAEIRLKNVQECCGMPKGNCKSGAECGAKIMSKLCRNFRQRKNAKIMQTMRERAREQNRK